MYRRGHHFMEWRIDYPGYAAEILSRRFVELEIESTETMKLKNGLTLEFLDRSKKIVGDRWLVSFAARVEMVVSPNYLEGQDVSEDTLNDIKMLTGEKASYHYNNERNFIDDEKKDAVFKELKESFLDTNLKYLSTPGFPIKLILSKVGNKP